MIFRPATTNDVPAIFAVRTAVRENHLSMEQMAKLGITPETVAEGISAGRYGTWVCEAHDRVVVGFAIANRDTGSIFALFVLPDYERRGIGGRLLDLAVSWLWTHGHDYAWLTTGVGSRAVAFYERRGWLRREEPYMGEYRFELSRATTTTSANSG